MEVREVSAGEKPYRPVPIRLINWAGQGLDSLGVDLFQLSGDALMRKAVKQTGLSDFGDDDFREGLERVVASLRSEARLTLLGKVVAQGDLVGNLVARLQLVEWRKKHPEVADEEIRAPLFINGLPRTGTSILHGLLDVDPANRSPLSWEVDTPVPPPRPETWHSDPRIKAVDRKLASFCGLRPGLEAVHELGASIPQECVVIMARNFRSQQFATMFEIPSYVEWIDDASFTRTYQWHKQYLQHLQSGGVRGERWLLKSPCHLPLLDHIFETYPDANIIHTHRDPIEVSTSVSSLFAMLRGISSDHIDCRHIGRQQLDWWQKLLGKAMEQRRRHADRQDQFIDIKMGELVADPLQVVERVYAHFGFELRSEVRAKMAAYLADHGREKHGSHTYDPADFGIDEKKEAYRFEEYCAHFGV